MTWTTLDRHRLALGDCLDVMAGLDPESLDACVTDPPYGLGFMGRAWDALPPGREWAEALIRVLKPGAHVVAFGGQRTIHRLTCALEDGGFEIRDQGGWLFYSGFPKSLDVSKAIDAAAGAVREVVGIKRHARDGDVSRQAWATSPRGEPTAMASSLGLGRGLETLPSTPDAQRWSGFGTALKPAIEPWILARKPLCGTVAANVLRYGTGALNIDGCRYGYGDPAWPGPQELQIRQTVTRKTGYGEGWGESVAGGHPDSVRHHPVGRWPANIYYCQKASRAERNIGIADSKMICSCETKRRFSWDSAAHRVNTPPATDTPQATATTGSTTMADSSSLMSLFGNSKTDPSQPDSTSTTSTNPDRTIDSKTCYSLTQQPTNESTGAVNSDAACGGSPVESAGCLSPSTKSTGISPRRDGRSTVGASRVIFESSLNESSVCERCGKPFELASHTTVKPIALMSWLARLVTPPGGTLIDPFLGSGTTAIAAHREGLTCYGIEREPEYWPILIARMEAETRQGQLFAAGGGR